MKACTLFFYPFVEVYDIKRGQFIFQTFFYVKLKFFYLFKAGYQCSLQ